MYEILLFILYALVILTVAIFIMLFLYAKVARLLKKKSHHYHVPPKPDKDKNWHPIDFSKYDSYIFVQGFNDDYFVSEIDTFLYERKELIKLEATNIKFNLKEDWFLIKVEDTSFHDFKLLTYWLSSCHFESDSPKRVLGFCKHNRLPMKDYLFRLDKLHLEDHFIGTFRTGKNFGIYVPNAGLSEKGNISLTRNHEINFLSEESILPLELIEKAMLPFSEAIKVINKNEEVSV